MKNVVMDLPESVRVEWANTVGASGAGAAAAVASGDVVKYGSLFGVAAVAIAATTGTGILMLGGRVELNKTTGALAKGQILGYDFANKRVTTDLSGGACLQVTKAALSADTTVEGNLNPRPREFVKVITPSAGEAAANSMDVDVGFPVAGALLHCQIIKTNNAPEVPATILPKAGGGNENIITITKTDLLETDRVHLLVREATGA
jgi:predicted RecA/RadA family phage recombinase